MARRLGWLGFVLCVAACAGTAAAPEQRSDTPNDARGAKPSAATSSAPGSATAPTAQGAASELTAAVHLMPPGHDPVKVRVELARTPAERQRGLMYREQLDHDAGMLFLFERMQPLSFWMHNTYVPLDMIFIRDDLTVLGIVENAEPQTDSSRRVPGLSKYVLEVNAGFSREHGLGPGTQVRFEGVPGFEAPR